MVNPLVPPPAKFPSGRGTMICLSVKYCWLGLKSSQAWLFWSNTRYIEVLQLHWMYHSTPLIFVVDSLLKSFIVGHQSSRHKTTSSPSHIEWPKQHWAPSSAANGGNPSITEPGAAKTTALNLSPWISGQRTLLPICAKLSICCVGNNASASG